MYRCVPLEKLLNAATACLSARAFARDKGECYLSLRPNRRDLTNRMLYPSKKVVHTPLGGFFCISSLPFSVFYKQQHEKERKKTAMKALRYQNK